MNYKEIVEQAVRNVLKDFENISNQVKDAFGWEVKEEINILDNPTSHYIGLEINLVTLDDVVTHVESISKEDIETVEDVELDLDNALRTLLKQLSNTN